MDLVAEAKGDVVSFVQELEQKRKQLDEQIHRFMAAKEREYKRFEQEIRRQYQAATPSDPTPAVPQESSPSPTSNRPSSRGGTLATSVAGQLQVDESRTNLRSQIDRRSANSGLEDVRPSSEREKDFMGLFTPAFLPLLDSNKLEIERSPSAPDLSDHNAAEVSQPRPDLVQRANTDPLVGSDSSARPGNGQRSQSCSSDGLVSALKSSSGRKPKPMRVMLQLADDMPAVHPNDDLPIEREYAPVRQAEAMHHSKSGRPRVEDESPLQSPKSPMDTNNALLVNIPPVKQMSSGLSQGLGIKPSTPLSPPVSRAHSRDNPTNNFDDVASPFPLDEETNGAQESLEPDWEIDFQENVEEAPMKHSAPPMTIPEISVASTPPAEVTGGQGVPMLKIRSSSSSSIQPISPGFSRPSVQEDPKFYFDTRSPETEQVEDVMAHGSFYDSSSRPSLPGRAPMVGSLGESYMQRNAEEMMRRRRS